jgi:ribosomal-protein-serine acetyltransferase
MQSIIVTEEIQLVPPNAIYAEELHSIIIRENERLCEWLPWAHNYGSLEKSIAFTEQSKKNFDEKKGFGFTVIYKGKAIGIMGTHSIDYANKRTTIGYWLSEQAEGRGVMTACVRSLIEFCFEELELNRVEILCGTKNHKSNRIPQKLGFQLEGIFKKYELLATGYVDVNYYAMLKENWKK